MHLWFFATGKWLSGWENYDRVPSEEHVSFTFKRGYVWTREPHTESSNLERIKKLQEKANPERNQNYLLVNERLAKYN